MAESLLFLKKYWKRCLAIILILAICLTPVKLYADEEKWHEWSEDKQEEAWMVYTTTDWNKVSDFEFADDGSFAKADIPDDFREKYAGIVDSILASGEHVDTVYPAKNYKELLLAIAYKLNKRGGHSLEDGDVCYYNAFISDSVTVTSTEDSFKLLFYRLATVERSYDLAHDEPANIYCSDKYLGAVIQGVIYGIEYAQNNEQYTKANAKEWRKSHEGLKSDYDDLARDVLDIYSGVQASDNLIIG